MSKSENVIYLDFCAKNEIPVFDSVKYQKEIKSSYSFQKYVLSVRIEEFKSEFKNNLPSWLRRFL